MPNRRVPPWWARVLWYLLLAIVAGAFVVYLVRRSLTTMEVGQVARVYVERVRQGKLDAAYALLAPGTRRSVPRERFATALDNPLIRRAGSASFTRSVETHGTSRACLSGVLTGGKRRQVDVFVRRGADGWRVLAVRVDAPGTPPGPWSCRGR